MARECMNHVGWGGGGGGKTPKRARGARGRRDFRRRKRRGGKEERRKDRISLTAGQRAPRWRSIVRYRAAGCYTTYSLAHSRLSPRLYPHFPSPFVCVSVFASLLSSSLYDIVLLFSPSFLFFFSCRFLLCAVA